MNQPNCFHCGEHVPRGIELSVTVFAQSKDMCCLGCQAVCQSIVDSGLTSYYKHRTQDGVQVDEIIPQQLQQILAYDHDEIASEFVHCQDNLNEVILTVENVSCAACAWLIEGTLIKLNGLKKCNVNTTTARIALTWDPVTLKLSDIILAIAKVGYKAYPFQADTAEQLEVDIARSHLRRLTVAGLCTMQVMMFAFSNYFDGLNTLSDSLSEYFRWISFLITLPVVLYCASPFYKNAVSGLAAKRLNMDLPVTLAVLLAFFASAYATWLGTGHVYFESVSMFVFFLLLGRFFEQRARKKASQISSNLLRLIPTTANLVSAQQSLTIVPAKTLSIGDIVLVKPGETIPGDGEVINGSSQANESVLTGEQAPVLKNVNDRVYASTINIDSPLTINITSERSDQLISQIIRLQEQAGFEKPRLATIADSIAQYVVVAILLLSLCTYLGWWLIGSENALWYAIAVLVATCPCALSLATPSAYTCARATMSQHGLLLRSANALDILAKVDHVCFDKTGTLTTGHFSINKVITQQSPNDVLSIAAALESHSLHPIASAFRPHFEPSLTVTNSKSVIGSGIEGEVNGIYYRLGSSDFIGEKALDNHGSLVIHLANANNETLASFHLSDQLRPQSHALVARLNRDSISTTLLTGDNSAHAEYIANEVQVTHLEKGQTPGQKLNYIKQQQRDRQVVAMFGDGVNDAPVLAGAHVSFAMGSGSDIAKSSADVILLHDDLSTLTTSLQLSYDMQRIIKQNFCWALGYNALAVPFAVLGYLPPYIAALGMSLSSLIVVLNSLRLLKDKR